MLGDGLANALLDEAAEGGVVDLALDVVDLLRALLAHLAMAAGLALAPSRLAAALVDGAEDGLLPAAKVFAGPPGSSRR